MLAGRTAGPGESKTRTAAETYTLSVRLSSRRALGALGAAAGILPLLEAARNIAAMVAGPARLAGRELQSGDVKASTYAELFVLVFAVPAAAFLFGRLIPDAIRARGGSAVALPGLAFGMSFLFWRSGLRPRVCLMAGLVAAASVTLLSILGPRVLGRQKLALPGDGDPATPAPPSAEPPRQVSRGAAAVLLLVLFTLGFRMYWRPDNALDLFEDGHMLLPAQSYLSGAAPYADTYPIHGLGSDGGLDAAAFRLFGPTLAVYRLQHGVATAAAVAALGLACGVFFRRLGWAAVAFVLALAISPFQSDRQTPAFLALAALTWAAQTGRRRAWGIAGAFTSAALFYALDFGAMLLCAGFATAVSLALIDRRGKEAAESIAFYVMGIAAGALPFLGILAARGAADDFGRVSFLELPSRISDIWSLPAAAAAPFLENMGPKGIFGALVLGSSVDWLTFAALLALAAAVLLFRVARRELSAIDRGAIAATWFAMVAMRGVLGRADAGHLALYGTFTALPTAWLFYRAVRAPHAAWLFAPALGFVLLARFQPHRLPLVFWYGLRPAGHGADCRQTVPRSGASTVPCAQAADLAALRSRIERELAPGQTFFDFGNEPALYFLMDRKPPVRYCCVPFYEGEDAQREVIAGLERERPPLAILSSGTFLDALDNVPNRVRAPEVAAYLDRQYEPIGRVGTRTLGRRRPDTP